MIYLDWAATAPLNPEVQRRAGEKALELYANPSSTHQSGKAARLCIEETRENCAGDLKADPKRVYFTSGGSESNNIVFTSLVHRKARGNVVITGIEHPSVHEPAGMLDKCGFPVRYIRARRNGVVDPEEFAEGVDDHTLLAAVMHTNNETGAIQPVGAIAELIRKKRKSGSRRVHLHCDAVQAFGKIDISIEDLDVDSLSASGHKIAAPRGGGVLYLRQPLESIYRGGGQENGIRPGTENLQAIFGLGEALDRWKAERDTWIDHAGKLRQLMVDRISKIQGAVFFDRDYVTDGSQYSPFIILVSFPSIPGEVLVRVMNDRGFAISTGSACSSRGKKNLRVLKQMGIEKRFAESAVRISTGPETAYQDCVSFCGTLADEVGKLIVQIGNR